MSLQLFIAFEKPVVPYYFIITCNYAPSRFHPLVTVGKFRRYTYTETKSSQRDTTSCALYSRWNHMRHE